MKINERPASSGTRAIRFTFKDLVILHVVAVDIILLAKIHLAIRDHQRSIRRPPALLDREAGDFLVAVWRCFGESGGAVFAHKIQLAVGYRYGSLAHAAIMPQHL